LPEHFIRMTPMNVFDDDPLLGAVVSMPVRDQREPVRAVFHEEDGDWILSCGTVDTEDLDSWVTMHIHHVLDRDATVHPLGDLPPGWAAYRDAVTGHWEREPLSDHT
jgi:hypothetical protein